MNLIDEIRKSLAEVQDNSAMPVELLESSDQAWAIRKNGWYGVGVHNVFDKEISERFSNVRIWNQWLKIEGEDRNLLMLTSDVEYLRYEFATVCAEFVDPGDNGAMRASLLSNPENWWEKWKTLLGNSVLIKMPYSILGELIIYKHLIESGKQVKWAALQNSTHDIETEDESYEVKSTIKRYDSVISISSQHQLVRPKDGLYLCFCRFEESTTGKSIEEVINELVVVGCNYEKLNEALNKMGVEKGSSARNRKYKLHEARIYSVNESFPRITMESFATGKLPDGIVKIVYEVDLNGLEHCKLDLNI